MHVRSLLFVAAAAAATMNDARAASAGSVNVSPTRLTIVRSGTSADFGLTNEGASPVRFSVRAYRWDQEPGGAVRLTPTDDIIVFPQIVTVASQDHRTVRVAYTNPMPAAEGEYRIVATELPIADEALPQSGLAIRSRLSMPLFVVPPGVRHDVAIDAARATPRALSFELTERGTAHDVVQTVRVRGVDRDGATLFESTLEGWYVLPNEMRRFDMALPDATCRRLARVSVDATFENLPAAHASLVPITSC